MTPTVAGPCPACARPLERALQPGAVLTASSAPSPVPPCDHCGAAIALRADTVVDGQVRQCPLCGSSMLYRQKDFRQAIGCLVVLVAAILAPFTYYISLGVAALVDLLLYKLSGEVVICYRIACRAHVRGLAPGPKVGPFDLSIHDHHRALARREAQGLPGPDPDLGPPMDSQSHPH